MEHYLPTFDEFMNESDNSGKLNEYMAMGSLTGGLPTESYAQMSTLFDLLSKGKLSPMAKFWFGQRPPRTVLVLLPNFKGNKALPTLRLENTPPDGEHTQLPHLSLNGKILDVLFALPSGKTYRDMDFLSGHLENMENMDQKDLQALFQFASDAGDRSSMKMISDVMKGM